MPCGMTGASGLDVVVIVPQTEASQPVPARARSVSITPMSQTA
jgi:hypothetical protein